MNKVNNMKELIAKVKEERKCIEDEYYWESEGDLYSIFEGDC